MDKVLTIMDNVKIVIDEVAREVLNYCPQIYAREPGKTNGKKVIPCASSILITHEQKYFLITAGHVVQDYNPEDLGILIGNVFNFLNGTISYVNPYKDDKSNKIDVAIWKLDEYIATLLKNHFKFMTIEKFELNHQLRQKDPRYLVVGFPWRRAKFNPISKKIKISPFIFLTNVADERVYGELKLEKHTNIILNYLQRKIIDGKTGYTTKGVTPDGISGCGVWLIENFIYSQNKGPSVMLAIK